MTTSHTFTGVEHFIYLNFTIYWSGLNVRTIYWSGLNYCLATPLSSEIRVKNDQTKHVDFNVQVCLLSTAVGHGLVVQ